MYNKGVEEVGELKRREEFIAGIALYLGDGCKGDKSVEFSNSNPKIIRFMMVWFRKYCKVPDNKFRGAIWIHDNQDKKAAKSYWSEITGIPESQFNKTYVVKNKLNSNKVRKNINEHGVFTIRIFDVDLQRKIHGWMAGIIGKQPV